MSGLRASLRVPEFRALLVSYVINRAGDVVGALALAVIVFGATGSALATAMLFMATQFVPGLVGPPIVARIDQAAPGRILPGLYVVEGGLFVLLAALVHHAAIAPIVAIAFIDATLAFCARTITRSAVASTLIPHDLMPEGKAAFNLALATAMIAGPVVAGLAIAILGGPVALLVDGGSFLLAATLIARAPALRAGEPARPTGLAVRGRLRQGLRYIGDHPTLRALIVGEGLAFVFFYLVVPVTVVYATRSLHAGAGGYAAILAAWGIGMALGSAAQVRLARRVGTALILLSTLAVATGYLGTAVAATLPIACAASVVGGLGNGLQWASVETTVHQLVEEAFRTRVAAVLEALAAMAPGAGILLGGLLTSLFSPRAAYLAAGLGLVVLVSAAAVRALIRSVPAVGVSAAAGSNAQLSVSAVGVPAAAGSRAQLSVGEVDGPAAESTGAGGAVK
jgi:MFS family permease